MFIVVIMCKLIYNTKYKYNNKYIIKISMKINYK